MKIAFTYNLQLATTEEEAEFDRPETVQMISEALQRLGHDVELVEVSGPASRVVARLEAMGPDLVFNTAEGRRGRYREAFYPALYDQLSLPYTGSDAYVCALTLDKQWTKMWLANHGIPTPRWVFIDDWTKWTPPDLAFPVILKPNFEGSSKGISQDSIVEDPNELEERAQALVEKYPAGVLIEQYIPGRDISVAFLEKASPRTGGILPPVEYELSSRAMRNRKYNIYDFDLKQIEHQDVAVRVPTDLTPQQTRQITEMSKQIFELLGVRDLGRVDFRQRPDGRIYFIEVNALPSLEAGAGIYLAAQQIGLKKVDDLLRVVIRSAAERQGIKATAKKWRGYRKNYRVGLTYNLKRVAAKNAEDDDREAEYDSQTTVDAIARAVASYGHEVVYLEATPELPAILGASQVDFVFNIAEGIKGRNREAHVPAILELLDIPYTGSDAATLSITLDKGLSKRVLMHAGIPTPKFVLMRTGKERLPKDFSFPVILKPVAEGSSKGVMGINVAEDEAQLREIAAKLVTRYDQDVLVEEFLPGREFTVALLGDRRPKALPPMEIVFTDPNKRLPVYSFEHKLASSAEIRYDAPAKVEPRLRRELERVARRSFMALGCRDVARIDLRLDAKGRVYFIECNPLPGLTPGWSDLCLITESVGIDYRTLIGEIMAPTIRRLRQKEKQMPGHNGKNHDHA